MSSQQSQSQPQSHTDFLVGIATENASLKVQIKQEYDNSCAIVHQINKSIREIDSCKRDLNKFRELRDAKVSELKRLEADLESSYSSRERIKNNIDHLKTQKDHILMEENQKLVERDSIRANYEQMIYKQMEINSSHPLVMRKDAICNLLKQYEIRLAVLKKCAIDWSTKENQIRTIHDLKLKAEVVHLAQLFIERRTYYQKKLFLAQQLEKSKVELQKLLKSKQNQSSIKSTDPVFPPKPVASLPVSKNMSSFNLPSNIPPSFFSLSGSITKQSDLMKHFQQVSIFKTPHQLAPSSKFSRPFSPRAMTQKLKLPFSRVLKSPTVDKHLSQSSLIRSISHKVKHPEDTNETSGIPLPNKNMVNPIPDANEFTSVRTETNSQPVRTETNSQLENGALNNEVAAINSVNEVCQTSSGIFPGDVPSSGKITSSQAVSCRSNCSTPVSIRSAGSQKEKFDRPMSRISTLRSPRPVDRRANFSPISKVSLTPRVTFKRNIGPIPSCKPYRTPDILQKLAKEKVSSANKVCSSVEPSKNSKQAKIDLDTSSEISLKSKFENTYFGGQSRAPQVEKYMDSMGTNTENQNLKSCPTPQVHFSSYADETLKISNHQKVSRGTSSKENKISVLAENNEVNQSKYFRNANQESFRRDENTGENIGQNDENVFSYSIDDSSKANCVRASVKENNSVAGGFNTSGSTSSRFSSIIMRGTDNMASSSSPMGNFVMPFSCSGDEGGAFGFSNSNDNNGFTLSGGFTSKDASSSNAFLFNIPDDTSKPTFSLF